MRDYTEVISWSKRRRHLTTAAVESGWRTGPALCSPYTYGATADDAKRLDRLHPADFNAAPLCKTCARIAEGDAEYDAKTYGHGVVNNAIGWADRKQLAEIWRKHQHLPVHTVDDDTYAALVAVAQYGARSMRKLLTGWTEQ